MGTPIALGLGPLQDFVTQAAASGAAALNFDDPISFGEVIGQWSALMHLPMAIILPIFMLGFITRFFGPNRSWADGFGAWKFCIFASVAFAIPYVLLAWLIGPEFPSLVGGLIGLALWSGAPSRALRFPRTFSPSVPRKTGILNGQVL